MAKNTTSPYVKAFKFTLAPSILIYLCSVFYTWSFTIPIGNFKSPDYGWVRLLMLICEIGFYIFLVYTYENKVSSINDINDLNFKEYTPPYSSDSVSDRTASFELRRLLYDKKIRHNNNTSNLRVFYSKNMVIVTDMNNIETSILSKIFTENENNNTTAS